MVWLFVGNMEGIKGRIFGDGLIKKGYLREFAKKYVNA